MNSLYPKNTILKLEKGKLDSKGEGRFKGGEKEAENTNFLPISTVKSRKSALTSRED